MRILYIILTLLFAILLTIFAKRRFNTFSPARLFTYCWTFQIIFMVSIWHNYLYFSYTGLLYILLCIAVFDIGATVESSNHARTTISGLYHIEYNPKYVKSVYLCVLIIAVTGNLYSLSRTGFSVNSLMSLESFMDMSNQNSIERYSGEGDSGGLLGRVFAMNAFACPLVGGMVYYYFRRKMVSVLSIFPMIFSGLAQGVKMGIITGSFMWIIGLIISMQLLDRKINFRFKHLLLIIIIVCSFVLVLLMSMMFRIGRFDVETFETVTTKFMSYSLGHLPAFDMWFGKMDPSALDYTFGGKLFYGITNSLGILERRQGVFTEMYVISKGGDSTNVFTVFRLIIEDFGVILTIPFFLIMGIVTQKIHQSFLLKQNISVSLVLMSAIYFFISWSFATSIFAYATYIIMFVYVYIISRLIFFRYK